MSGKASSISNIVYILKLSYRKNRLLFGLYGSYAVLNAIQPFIPVVMPKKIIDELMGQARVHQLLLLLFLMSALSAFLGYVTSYLQGRITPEMIKTVSGISLDVTERNLSIPYQKLESKSYLNQFEIASRFLTDQQKGFQGFIHSLFTLSGSVLGFFGFIAVLKEMPVYFIIFLLVSSFGSYYFLTRANRYEASQRVAVAENERKSSYLSKLMQTVSYAKEVRLHNLAPFLSRLFSLEKKQGMALHTAIRSKRNRSHLGDAGILFLRDGIVFGFIILQYSRGEITIGSLAMVLSAVTAFSAWSKSLLKAIADIRLQSAFIEDLRLFLGASDEEEDNLEWKLPSSPYTISFDNISFRYSPESPYVFNAFSLTIPPLQKLALVGQNGCGKSTLVKLLCRFYEPEEGCIRINGIDIASIPHDIYLTLLSSVFQEIHILAFSILENITLDNSSLQNETLDKVVDCLQKADLYADVSKLTHGVNTSARKILDEEGVELSGGQKQKLATARGLYKQSILFLLDEPTAALDALAEEKSYKDFEQAARGKTTVYISHRLSSTKFCDRIAFLDRGRLAEYGTHEELMHLQGLYYSMYTIQAQYYQKKEHIHVKSAN
ncbi:MAG: hypothetical protein K0R57_957 [Paenibacillaceae bacterium]|jgi:ATP-binding cassette subfamily C protein|nr:hypothetical protein [Paenibacillaceae bacterium]